MAASMGDASKSLQADQTEEISSSSEKVESKGCENADICLERECPSAETINEDPGLYSVANRAKTFQEAEGAEYRTEHSETGTPMEKAGVSSTLPEHSAVRETFATEDDSTPSTSVMKDQSLLPSESVSETPSSDFKVPAAAMQSSNSKTAFAIPKIKMRVSKLQKTESVSETKNQDNAMGEESSENPAASSSDKPSSSSSSTVQGKNKGIFAFALPKSLPKSKHKSFHGSSAQEDQEATDNSDVPEGFAADKKLPQEKDEDKVSVPPLPYKEPSWSGIPVQEYYLEVLKNGAILSKISLNDQPFHVFGRLDACDVQLDHPSLSRYHMVLQYRLAGDGEHDAGFYVYDLGSTHGSFMNKQKLNAKAYYRMNVGHMFKLGGSTRLFILQGPSEDQEPESEMSVTELKELRQRQMLQMEEKKRIQEEKKEELKMKLNQEEKPAGIDWGMGMDAGEEEDDEDEEPGADNPFAMETQEEREAAYVKDPKKTLRGFFEREDVELEYNVEEKGVGFSHQYVCRVELPIDDSMGNPIFAEAAVSGKKKEAVIACALEACRILDAHGVLRQATHESKKRKAKDWAQDDYYDSDDDTFLDRTGVIEKKRKQRMKKAGVIQEKAETYDSLLTKLKEVDAELEKTEKQLEEAKKAQPTTGGSDSLDDFIANLKAGGSSHDRAQRAKLKLRVVDLRKEQFRLQRLAQVARPASIPQPPKPRSLPKGGALPMIGSMKSRSNFKDRFKPKIQIGAIKLRTEADDQVVEEEEEEEDEDETTNPADIKGASVEDMETDAHQDGKLSQSPETLPSRPVKGPQLPPSWKGQQTDPSEREEEERTLLISAAGKPKRVYGPAMPPMVKDEQAGNDDDDEEEEEEEDSASTSQRVYGPAMPPPATKPSKDDRVVRGPARGPSKADFRQRSGVGGVMSLLPSIDVTSGRDDEGGEGQEEGPDYSAWQPPTDQKGDGRTKLNEKLGY